MRKIYSFYGPSSCWIHQWIKFKHVYLTLSAHCGYRSKALHVKRTWKLYGLKNIFPRLHVLRNYHLARKATHYYGKHFRARGKFANLLRQAVRKREYSIPRITSMRE